MKNFLDTSPLELAEKICTTMMNKFAAENLPPEGHFHYHQGVFLSGMEQTYLNTGKKKYSDYIKAWVDSLIDSEGNMTGKYNTATLDDKQPAILLFRLFQETGDSRYEKAIQFIKKGLDNWPCNEVGGFWHQITERCKNQMWLDGLYMAGELLARYGAQYNDTACFDTLFHQAKLMWENIRDSRTGLLYHAWDHSREAVWCNKETGLAPEFWGRAAGWYIVALTTMLDYIPKDYVHRSEMIEYVREYIKSFTAFQDEKSGLWYQVLNKTDDPNNWTETSCTSLFLCGISKALKNGYIDHSYMANADRAFKGLASVIKEDENGGAIMPDICIGTGVGDYQFYLDRPTSENDLHGTGALLLACNAYYDLKYSQDLSSNM